MTASHHEHVDPVCHMTVDPAHAAGTSTYEGTTYYFCSPGCKTKFDKDPAAYLNPPTANRQPPTEIKTIASFRRAGIDDFVQRTLARIERFRSDIEWHLYEHPPLPADLASVDLWVDPALADHDFDGFVAEALVVGVQVVAGRTAINTLRLERGRTGFLVPPNDPNEMTHAILAALFKPEVAESRVQAAKQTRSKFRPRQRARVLVQQYEALIS
jgi:YHS domain-containing protein/glycosyltransferase involved in cell wall biosynthesis